MTLFRRRRCRPVVDDGCQARSTQIVFMPIYGLSVRSKVIAIAAKAEKAKPLKGLNEIVRSKRYPS
jgi:hypothetical protein